MAKYRKLSRTSSQRKALLRGQVTALIANGKIVTTEAPAFTTMLYGDGEQSCAVAYKGNDYKAISYGFPLECIVSPEARSAIFAASIQFLLEK